MSLSFPLSQIKKHIPGEDKKILMTKNSQGSQRKPYYIIIFNGNIISQEKVEGNIQNIERNCQPRIIYPAKLSFSYEEK